MRLTERVKNIKVLNEDDKRQVHLTAKYSIYIIILGIQVKWPFVMKIN